MYKNMYHCIGKVKVQPLSGILALFLFICFVYPCVGNTGRETVVVFQGGKTEVAYDEESTSNSKSKPLAFRVPAFVGGIVDEKEFLAVFCKGHYQKNSNLPFTNLATRRSHGNFTKWSDAEQFPKTTAADKEKTNIIYFTAVINGDKIYALATNFDKSNGAPSKSSGSTSRWEPFMFIGTVKPSGGSGSDDETVTWENGKPLKDLIKGTADHLQVFHFVGGRDNGVVMKNGTIVFPIQIVNKQGNNSASIIYSSDNGTKWHIGGERNWGTFAGSVVEFGEGKLLFFVRLLGGLRDVLESDDMGTTWKKSLVFSGVWPEPPNRFGAGSQGTFITASVEGKDVLFFSNILNNKGGDNSETLQLWISDGQRIKCIGDISEKSKGDHYGSSILANVGDHLYVTYEINPVIPVDSTDTNTGKWNRVIAITSLPKFFDSAKSTVREWRTLDASLQTKSIPTDDLVGLLRNTETADNSVWTDKYNCVNAIVKNGQPVDGGFRFSGVAGSGAQWPVSIQGQNQVYAFAQKQFTLAATVIIHNAAATGQFPLIGASVSPQEDNLLIGLGYTKENKWCAVGTDKTETASENKFEKEKEYHVALTFKGRAISVYVDGEDVLKGTLKTISETAVIQKFVIGNLETNINAEGDSCTVNNVMLFNRPLTQNEIAILSTVSKNGNLDKPVPTEDSTAVLVSGRSKQSVEPTILPVITKSEQSEEPTTKQVSDKSGKSRESTTLPVIDKTLSTTKPKDTSGTEDQKLGNGNAMDKTLDHALLKHHNATLQKATNRADSSTMSFGFVQLTCVVCSIILLVQF